MEARHIAPKGAIALCTKTANVFAPLGTRALSFMDFSERGEPGCSIPMERICHMCSMCSANQ